MWSVLRKNETQHGAQYEIQSGAQTNNNTEPNGTQSGAQIVSTQAEGLELGLVTCPATACWPANYSPQTFPELVKGSRFRG